MLALKENFISQMSAVLECLVSWFLQVQESGLRQVTYRGALFKGRGSAWKRLFLQLCLLQARDDGPSYLEKSVSAKAHYLLSIHANPRGRFFFPSNISRLCFSSNTAPTPISVPALVRPPPVCVVCRSLLPEKKRGRPKKGAFRSSDFCSLRCSAAAAKKGTLG